MDRYGQMFTEFFGVPKDAPEHTIVHAPCPACGAPDFWVFPCGDAIEHFQRTTTCNNCDIMLKCAVEETEEGVFNVQVIHIGGPANEHCDFPRLQ